MIFVLSVSKATDLASYKLWMESFGVFIGLSPFLSIMPPEVFIREINKKGGKFSKFRILFGSVIARSICTFFVVVIAFFSLLLSGHFGNKVVYNVMILLIIGAVVESISLGITINIRNNVIVILSALRLLSCAAKVFASLILISGDVNFYMTPFLYYSDAIVFAVFNFLVCAAGIWLRPVDSRRYFNKGLLLISIKFALSFIPRAIPASMSIMLSGLIFKSDRFIYSFIGDPNILAQQAACMQFIDPIVLTLTGFVAMSFTHNRAGVDFPYIKYVSLVLLVTIIVSIVSPFLVMYFPSNINYLTSDIWLYSWYIPVYTVISMLALKGFYYKGSTFTLGLCFSYLICAITVITVLSELDSGFVNYAPIILSIFVIIAGSIIQPNDKATVIPPEIRGV
jgi:hypothetical protein